MLTLTRCLRARLVYIEKGLSISHVSLYTDQKLTLLFAFLFLCNEFHCLQDGYSPCRARRSNPFEPSQIQPHPLPTRLPVILHHLVPSPLCERPPMARLQLFAPVNHLSHAGRPQSTCCNVEPVGSGPGWPRRRCMDGHRVEDADENGASWIIPCSWRTGRTRRGSDGFDL